jgi:tetratricopeptide (TPR) repeat protein
LIGRCCSEYSSRKSLHSSALGSRAGRSQCARTLLGAVILTGWLPGDASPPWLEVVPKPVVSAFRRTPAPAEAGACVVLKPVLAIRLPLEPDLISRLPTDTAWEERSRVHEPNDQADALQQAAILVQQGRLDEAEQQARLALSNPETRAVAYSVLGTIRSQQKRFDESVGFFQKAIALNSRLLGAHLSLGQIYTLQGKSQQALALFRRALELDPLNPVARLAVAHAEMDKANYRRSLDLAQPVLDDFKHSPEGLYVLATGYLKTGDRAAAAELLKDWARLETVPVDWSVKFAVLLAKEGFVAESIGVLEAAKRATGPTYELAFNLGGVYLLNSDTARALDAYDLALSLEPGSIAALRQAAALAEGQGELERSLSYWVRARKIDPNDPEILLGFGRVCLKMDLLEDAEPALTRAASLKPEEPSYQYTLAATKVGKRQFEAAQALLEPLVQKRPADPQLQYALGAVLYIQGRLDEAAAYLRESVRLQPEQLASHYYLALIARDQGKDAEATDALEKLLQRYPYHAPSCEALGGLLMTAARYDDAEKVLREAIRLSPKSVKANYQLGLLLARMGKQEEAARQLELAKSLRQEDEATSRLQLRLLDPDK